MKSQELRIRDMESPPWKDAFEACYLIGCSQNVDDIVAPSDMKNVAISY